MKNKIIKFLYNLISFSEFDPIDFEDGFYLIETRLCLFSKDKFKALHYVHPKKIDPISLERAIKRAEKW